MPGPGYQGRERTGVFCGIATVYTLRCRSVREAGGNPARPRRC